jgi:hypothetical protein
VRLALFLLLTSGCRQIFGLDAPGGFPDGNDQAGADSGGSDANQLSDGSSLCFDRPEIGLAACLAALPTMPVTVPIGVSIDSGGSTYCVPLMTSSVPMCVVAGTSVTVASGVVARVTGALPIVVFSTGPIDIAGTIDVASHTSNGSTAGAGANDASCGTTAGGVSGSGGAGGSFTTSGGDGAKGALPGAQPGVAQPAVTAVTTFRGGCGGGLGSLGAAEVASGGGVIALISRAQITIDGLVDASGGGGPGAAVSSHGGYGGGSGGMIVLVTPNAIAGNGSVRAHGGGGGGGSSQSTAGNNGLEGQTPTGGVGGNGGTGGGGYPLTSDGMVGMGQAGGGGGGGGGAGAIEVFAPGTSVVSSPSPIVHSF